MNKAKKMKKSTKKYLGTLERPRLSVFKTNKYIYAQVINDSSGETLAAQSDLKLKGEKKVRAYEIGKKIASKMKLKKIKKIVFDRGRFLYHGRIAELARGIREGGIEF